MREGSPAAGARLRVQVLGPLRAWRGEQWLDLGPVRQQAVLAALVLSPDATVSRLELLDRVWGLEPPGTGVKVLPGYIYRLRGCLRGGEAVIASARGGYHFVSAEVDLDVAALEAIAAEASIAERTGDLAKAVELYAKALGLYHGEPLAGVPGPFAEGERQRLVERRIALTQRKLDGQLRLGRHADAVAELSALVQTNPHSEPLAALLMRALYAGGRQDDALAVFTQTRRRLVDDLGVEPGPELHRTQQAVLRGDNSIVGQQKKRNELPADVGELAGRDPELANLTEPDPFGRVSIHAIDGVPGAGKTALAIRAAHQIWERFQDGALFLNLHAHNEGWEPLPPQRALRRLLRSVGFDDGNTPDDLDELAACWRSATATMRLLLILDDAAGAEQVRPLLPGGPGSRVLVTSRRRLTGLDVDRRISLGALDIDAAERLLGQIVGAPRTDRERDSARVLARLCGRLPLALRIAAAKLQNRPEWTFGYLVARLAGEDNRFGELKAEDRCVETALRLSYDQLPTEERQVFRALGQCPTVEVDRLAVAAMLNRDPHHAERALENLVDASLLEQPSAGRYRLHDLVAVFARRLGSGANAEAVSLAQQRVLRLYVAAARHSSDWGPGGYPSGPDLAGAPFASWQDAATWLDAAGAELTDVVGHAAAMGHADYACWVAEAVVDYLTRQGRYHECRAALEVALSLLDQVTDDRMASSLRICLGFAYALRGDLRPARTAFADALRIAKQANNLREHARALGGVGMIDLWLGRHAEGFAAMTEMLAMAERLDDDWLIGMATALLGVAHRQAARHPEALDLLTRSLGQSTKMASPRLTARTLCHISYVHLDLAQHAEAAEVLERAITLAEQVGDLPLQATCLTRLGTAEQGLGRPQAAVALHSRALDVLTEQTAVGLEIEIRKRFGASLLAAGNPTGAQEQRDQVRVLAEKLPFHRDFNGPK